MKRGVDPAEFYSRRLAERESSLARHNRLHERMGTLRLAVAASLPLLGWACITQRVAAPWLALPIVAFTGAVWYHQRIRQARARADRSVAFYRTGLDRLEGKPVAAGPLGDRFRDEHHLYAADLDVFGAQGLFQSLCTARTPMGERTLADWLLAPAALATILQRHAAVAELRDRVDFREELAVAGEPERIALRTQELLRWATAPGELPAGLQSTALLLTAAALASALLWAGGGPAFPFLAIFVVQALLQHALRRRLHGVMGGVEHAHADLASMTLLLTRIEKEPFTSEPLLSLQRMLHSSAGQASVRLSKLATIVNVVEARRNPFLAPISVALLYNSHGALAVERWRRRHGGAVASWLLVVGEIEALQSIARRSFERPSDVVPEFSSSPNAEFLAVDLGHPLLPDPISGLGGCIRNDVDVAGATRLLMVSGSNMSGKSTLLRAVGLNTVLAMAGAPVRAAHLRLTPLQVGASIRVNDSLFDGSSRFYAEITRLRQLFAVLDTASVSAPPLLFLLDELLQGTNSADRLIGARGVLGELVDRGAIGLVSTHDLALADDRELPPGALRNVHFQDELYDGILRFDFKLREGIVTKSNALELMRAIGLKV